LGTWIHIFLSNLYKIIKLLNGYTPWTANSEFELIKNIETKPLKFLVDLSATTKDFLTKCLKPTEKSRISWD
jgi:serine/threonine protein kinase